ncbi:MAG: DUF4381 family protein [Pseudomonadota bacterium]
MSPDEILQELRDIHLPEIERAAEPLTLDPLPFVLFAALVGIVALIRYRQNTRWRRQATTRLDEIERMRDPDQALGALVRLLQAMPGRTQLSSLPRDLFEKSGGNPGETVQALTRRARELLREGA